jgi:hypothetical protein
LRGGMQAIKQEIKASKQARQAMKIPANTVV